MFDFIPTFNGGLLTGLALVAAVMLIRSSRPDWGAAVAYRTSERARLPFGSDDIAMSVRRRSREIVRANMWSVAATVAVSAVIFATTPLAGSPFFLWIVTLMLFLAGLTASTLVVGVRERLFHPAPTAVRIARTRSLSTRDYLGVFWRRAPDVILAAAVVASLGLAITQLLRPVDAASAWLSWITIGLAVAIAIGGRLAERLVLAQPQPASNTLELAWDDLFRGDTLSVIRMGSATAAWLAFGLAATVTVTAWWPPASGAPADVAGLFPWWGVPLLQVLYILGQGRLPAALYPDFLLMPGLTPSPDPA